MKSIFLADAHLRNPADPAYQDLLIFLKNLPADLENLFILGDFFDFWHGYQNTVLSHYTPILNALKGLADKGVNIHFFAGNHEVSCGPRLQEIGSCHMEYARVEIDNQKIYLAHGDRLNPEDYLYRLWRSFLRSRFTRKILDILPIFVTLKIADTLSRSGQRCNENRKLIPPQVLNSCAALLKDKDDIQAVVIGHFHQKQQETFTTRSGPKSLYILGAWINNRSYLQLENGQFSFHQSVSESV